VPVLAALSGWVATISSGGWVSFALLVGAACAADASRRAWLLPVWPRAAVLPWSFDSWRELRETIRLIKRQLPWDPLIRLADGGIIAVDSGSSFEELNARGGRATLLFSPALAPCFEDATPPARIAAELRQNGVRLFAISLEDPIAGALWGRHPFFRRLREGQDPVLRAGAVSVYDLNQFESKRMNPSP
jgi:hypothetical protein